MAQIGALGGELFSAGVANTRHEKSVDGIFCARAYCLVIMLIILIIFDLP